ncbi:MFS transporter [Streptomyces sp. NRRL F-5123]|uniref:MFS transporter n=1 Tax=Streptomyces sp. NRRL F-5123 TaxID=1463856 RepID=UPI0006942E88|nr:MFS transporter [Streptomyces sp. NRRL F-5123]
MFLLNGLTLSTSIARQPSLKSAHHLSDGQVGLLGLLFAGAAIVAMQFVGPLVARVGSRPVLRVSLVVMPLLLALVGLAGGFGALAAANTALGAVHGTTDAAMNAHAVAVEKRAGRRILSGCHAAWSISAVVASLVTAGLSRAGVTLTAHFVGAAAVLAAAGLVLGRLLLPAAADRGSGAGAPARRDAGRWSAAFVALGLTGTALMVCEGAALGWGPIFLHDARGVPVGLAATAVTAYAGGQTAVRVVGDRLATRYGAPRVFRAGGLVAVAGLGAAVSAAGAVPAVAGFAVMGAGMSVLLPLAFSAVGRTGGVSAATAVSRFTTFTYAGVLLGPAAVGWAAELGGLTRTLAALLPVLLAVTLLTRLPDPRPVPEDAPADTGAAVAAGRR